MREVLAMVAVLVVFGGAAPVTVPAAAQQAREYPWCALYGRSGTTQNCGFMTLEQCRQTISGIGGRCVENPFYRGHVTTQPQPRPRPQQ